MAVKQSTMRGSPRGERARLLPSGAGDFFRRRLIQAAGLAAGLCGLLVFVACLTYNPADPSGNRAADGPVSNLLGGPGAVVADFLIQTLGLAAFLATPALMVWAWRIMREKRLPHWWLRLAFLPPALLLLAAGLSTLPSPGGWLPDTKLGGVAGQDRKSVV